MENNFQGSVSGRGGERRQEFRGEGQGGDAKRGRSASGGPSITPTVAVIAALALAALVAIVFAGPSLWNGGAGGDAVAVVNGEEIPREEYEQQLNQQLQVIEQQLQQQGQNVDVEAQLQTARERLPQQIVTSLINQELVTQAARKAGIEVTDQEVQQAYQQQVSAAGGAEAVQERLEQAGVTEEEVKESIRTQLLIEKYVDSQAGNIQATDSEVQALYNQAVAQLRAQSGTSTPTVPSLEEVRANFEQRVIQNKRQAALNDILEQEQKNAEIEVLLDEVTYAPASNPLPQAPAESGSTEGAANTASPTDGGNADGGVAGAGDGSSATTSESDVTEGE